MLHPETMTNEEFVTEAHVRLEQNPGRLSHFITYCCFYNKLSRTRGADHLMPLTKDNLILIAMMHAGMGTFTSYQRDLFLESTVYERDLALFDVVMEFLTIYPGKNAFDFIDAQAEVFGKDIAKQLKLLIQRHEELQRLDFAGIDEMRPRLEESLNLSE